MDLKLVKDLIALMQKAGLSKLHIKEKNGVEVILEKGGEIHSTGAVFQHPPAAQVLAPKQETVIKEKEEKSGHFIKSPIVGTFYNSPSPTDGPFCKVGDKVEKGSVVCIIEAMKVMNEVKADRGGVIKEILIENMHPVEFGTKLFRIE